MNRGKRRFVVACMANSSDLASAWSFKSRLIYVLTTLIRAYNSGTHQYVRKNALEEPMSGFHVVILLQNHICISVLYQAKVDSRSHLALYA